MRPPTLPMPIYLLPGMGADARMFAPQRRTFPQLRVLDWLRPKPTEPMASYAARLASQIPPGPFILGGVSFGGIVAQALAAQRRPQALVLISTMTSSRELAVPFRWAHHLPRLVMKQSAASMVFVASLARPVAGRSGSTHHRLMTMLADTDPRFLAWALHQALNWRAPLCPAVPTLRLHGTRDWVIRPPATARVRWIAGGGHTMSMTHAQAVNRELRTFLDSLV